MSQEWPNMNRSLASRRSTKTNGQESAIKETLGSAHTSVAARLDPISRQTAGNEQRFSGLEKALYSRARQRSAVSRELIAGQEGNSPSLVTGLRGATPIEAAKASSGVAFLPH